MQHSLASINLKQSSTQRELICCWLHRPLTIWAMSGTLLPSPPSHILHQSGVVPQAFLSLHSLITLFGWLLSLPTIAATASFKHLVFLLHNACQDVWLTVQLKGLKGGEDWQRQRGGDLRPGLQRADVMPPSLCFFGGSKPGGLQSNWELVGFSDVTWHSDR